MKEALFIFFMGLLYIALIFLPGRGLSNEMANILAKTGGGICIAYALFLFIETFRRKRVK